MMLRLEGAAQAREADEGNVLPCETRSLVAICAVARGSGLVQLFPRLNSITWHPELAFLDDWWRSQAAGSLTILNRCGTE